METAPPTFKIRVKVETTKEMKKDDQEDES